MPIELHFRALDTPKERASRTKNSVVTRTSSATLLPVVMVGPKKWQLAGHATAFSQTAKIHKP